MKSYTPPKLIDEFCSLNGFFPTIQAPTEKIRELSTKFKCPFISYSVGPSRLTQIYACSNCKSIYNCKAKAKFSYEDGFARFVECTNEHSYPLNQLVDLKNIHKVVDKYKKQKSIDCKIVAILATDAV